MKPTSSFATIKPGIFFCLVSVLFYLFITIPLNAQSPADDPKLAIVLSGGGSKGIAQVGVLSLLEEEGIRPDIITGTSIGSILGGLYAIGYSVEDLEQLTMETDWASYFDDELDRRFFPIEERDAAERYQIRFPIDSGKVALPVGIVRGKKISLLLSRLTIPAHGIHDFDDFEIPFRAIATDLETGQAVVYGKGELADVMRASMSIPSVFVPFEIDGKLLIDGGVVRNLPVQDAIKLGADKVIAIDIGAPLYKKENLVSILEVLDQTSSFRIVESNKAQAKLADVVIRPEVGNISALAFDQNDTLMHRGKTATLQKLPEVKELFEGKQDLAPRGIHIPKEIKVVDLEILGCEDKELKSVHKLLHLQVGKKYTLEHIEEHIKELYGSELVALASYRIHPQDDGHKLTVNVEMQKGEFVRLSANYDSRLKAGLLLNLTLRNRLSSASKLNLDIKISENPSYDLDYYVHMSRRPNISWHLGNRLHLYPGLTYDNGSKGDLFDLRHFNIETNMFSSFANHHLIAAGVGIERYARSEEYFDPSQNNLRIDQAFVQLRLLRDSYNREHFPTDGSYFNLEGKYLFARRLKSIASDSTAAIRSDNAVFRLQANKAFSFWKRITPIIGVDAGYTRRVENNYFNRFYLGRALPNEWSHIEFFGLQYMELPVSAYVMGQFKWQMEIAPDIFTSFVYNSAFYRLESLRAEEGVVTDEVIREEKTLHGAGIELGWLTRLGPALFTTEYNFTEGRMNFSLHLGHWF